MTPDRDAIQRRGEWQRGVTLARQQQWDRAAAVFADILRREPGHVPSLLASADALLRLDRYREARQHALNAAAHAGDFPALRVEICQRLRAFQESARLLELARQADQSTLDDTARATDLASMASMAGDQALAAALIEYAVRADPADAKARYMRGVIAMFQGDMPHAKFELAACLAIAPSFAQAHWVLSSLQGAAQDADIASDEAIERIRACLDVVPPHGNAEAYLAFALHNRLHARQRFDEAWQALARGCAAKHATVPYDPQRTSELFAGLQSLCSRDFVSPVPVADGGFTPIFIVGMHRSGTTLLERILAGHSQVADGGETYAFTAQLDFACDHKTSGALDLVTLGRIADADFAAIGSGFLDASRWRARGKAFMTEKLPPNFLNAGFIAKALPGARILHMVRDPIDTCFSNLRTYFTQAAAYSYDQLQLADYHACYRGLMRHWHDVMPNRILDVSYGELVNDTEATARRIFEFCGLPFEASALAPDAAGPVATASTAYVRQGILRDRGQAWKPYAAHLRPMLERLSVSPQ
jgi:tetratricopeptide (TPR) repeat protein